MKPRKIENLNKAFLDLKESLAKPIQENRDVGGVIKAFEIVFELSWKTLQDLNQEMGTPSAGPREALERAFENKIIENDTVWVQALKDRNLTVHTYDHQFAKEMLERIRLKYCSIFEALLKKLAQC